MTAKIRKGGEAGQLFAPQASSPLINTAGAASERGRNILSDRGEQALIELSLPLFPLPLRSGEVGRILPLDLVQVLAAEGTWHGLCTASRIEVRRGCSAGRGADHHLGEALHRCGLICGGSSMNWSAAAPG